MGRRSFLLVLGLLLAGVPAVRAADPAAPPPPGPQARCPVCGMFVAGYGNWLAVAVLADGTARYFDGPKDLFRYAFDPARFEPGGAAPEVVGRFVTDYYTTRLVPAETARFVVGSDVLGPMGHELVPVVGDDAVRSFLADHHGSHAYPLSEVTPEVLSKLP